MEAGRSFCAPFGAIALSAAAALAFEGTALAAVSAVPFAASGLWAVVRPGRAAAAALGIASWLGGLVALISLPAVAAAVAMAAAATVSIGCLLRAVQRRTA